MNRRALVAYEQPPAWLLSAMQWTPWSDTHAETRGLWDVR